MFKINEGFQIEDPNVFVPWGITEEQLLALLGKNLRHVTEGYFAAACTSLGGMKHQLGFHFEPRKKGHLTELEFFRTSYADPKGSFHEFQKHFEGAFGRPTASAPGNEGFSSYEWKLEGATIVHYVFDRFGPEEHMRIKRGVA